jgi:hypothetical protein
MQRFNALCNRVTFGTQSFMRQSFPSREINYVIANIRAQLIANFFGNAG